MAVTHAAGIRDGLANLIAAAHANGTGGDSTLELREGGDVIVTFDLGTSPFGSASSGIISLGGVPIDKQASDSAAALDNFISRDRDGGAVLAGSVTAVGMGGDIEVTNTNVANGQTCTLESLTYEAAP